MNVQPNDMRRLVRGWLFFALTLSLLANIGHTLLADSAVPVWLRMIGAVAWPLLVFAGVDITVKVAWDSIVGKRAGIHLARLLILLPGIPAAITSYEHMHAVLLAMVEKPFIAMIGPGAVDLMMIGCTITLVLLQRTARQLATPAVVVHEEEPEAVTVVEEGGFITMNSSSFMPAPWSTLPPEQHIVMEGGRPSRVEETPAAKPRGTKLKADQTEAISMLLAGDPEGAVALDLMGASTMRRYKGVLGLLREDSNALNDDDECRSKKVRPELVRQIREHVTGMTP